MVPSGNSVWPERFVERPKFAGRERHLRRVNILVEISTLLGARNADDVVALREHPGVRELDICVALLRRHLLNVVNEPQITSEILILRPWPLPRKIASFEIFNIGKRTIGNKTDCEFANRGENLGRLP
jgi:hypothetical protein